MSALHPHIRTLRALAAAFHGQALTVTEVSQQAKIPTWAEALAQCGYMAALLRDACRHAADELEAYEELEAYGVAQRASINRP